MEKLFIVMLVLSVETLGVAAKDKQRDNPSSSWPRMVYRKSSYKNRDGRQN